MIYAKSCQWGALFNYYEFNWSLVRVGVEIICFLYATPSISYREYVLNKSSDLVELDDLTQDHQRITKEEYQAAYKLATAGLFTPHLPN